MNYFAVTSLVNGLVSTVCGATVFFNNPKSYKNRIYALYCVSLSIWAYSYTAWQMSATAPMALFFSRALMMGAIFIPAFHYHHILSMFDLETRKRRLFLKIIYFLSLVYFLSNFTPLFIQRVEPRLSFPFWPVPGPFFHAYLFGFGVLFILALTLIWEFRTKASPLIRNQIVWVAVATAIGYGGGATNFLLWYNIPMPPYFNITVCFVIGTTALMFFKLQLLDIRLFLRDTTVHVVASLLVGLLGALLFVPISQNFFAVLFIISFSILSPLLYKPTYRWVRENINRTRLGKVDKYLGLVGENIDKIRETTYTYDDLAKNIVTSILKTFPVEMAGVYFFDVDKKELQLRAQLGMKNPLAKDLKYNRSALSIPENDPLVTYLTNRKEVVIKEEIAIGPKRRQMDAAAMESMEKLEAEACTPFLFAGSVKGLLVLGRKLGKQMFHQEDINAIYAFGRMGEEVMRYIMGMEHELLNTAMYSHDMDNDTKSLLQFLQFMQSPHAEKTPGTKLKELYKQATDIMARLNQTFQLNRDRSSLILRSIKGEYEKENVDIIKICQESCLKFEPLAKNKKVSFSKEVPPGPVSIYGNSRDLIRLLDNLFGNALRYVKPNGNIRVEGKEFDDGFQISVKDDGEGIAQEDLHRIWNFGWQARDAKQGASGLGLSIARQIVYLHGGKIWAESPGKGQGTTFSFILPLSKTSNEENSSELDSLD